MKYKNSHQVQHISTYIVTYLINTEQSQLGIATLLTYSTKINQSTTGQLGKRQI